MGILQQQTTTVSIGLTVALDMSTTDPASHSLQLNQQIGSQPSSTRDALKTQRIVPSPFLPTNGVRVVLPVPHPAHAYTPRANYLLDGASIDRILDHSLVFDRRVKAPQNVLDRDAFNQHLREFQVKKFNLPETKIYRPNQSYLGKSVRSRRGSNEGSSRVGLFVDIALFFKGTRFVSRQSI